MYLICTAIAEKVTERKRGEMVFLCVGSFALMTDAATVYTHTHTHSQTAAIQQRTQMGKSKLCNMVY